MSTSDKFIESQKESLLKAIKHLEYSYQKIMALPESPDELDEESLETWESFAARFGRVADIFLMKYARAIVLREDPGFTGTLRDFVSQAEKIGLIQDADKWMAIRELRNISAHEYTEKDLAHFFRRLKQEAPLLISIKSKVS